MFRLLFISLLTMATGVSSFAGELHGPGGTGGGNEAEVRFILAARKVLNSLKVAPAVSEKELGISLSVFEDAIGNTQVQCSFGESREILKELNKSFYFDSPTNSIYFDCENAGNLLGQSELELDILILHEYMRKAVQESSAYEVSSRLSDAWKAENAEVARLKQEREAELDKQIFGGGMKFEGVNKFPPAPSKKWPMQFW